MPFEDHLRARGDATPQDTAGRSRGSDSLNFNVSQFRHSHFDSPNALGVDIYTYARYARARARTLPETKFITGRVASNEFSWKSLMANVFVRNNVKTPREIFVRKYTTKCRLAERKIASSLLYVLKTLLFSRVAPRATLHKVVRKVILYIHTRTRKIRSFCYIISRFSLVELMGIKNFFVFIKTRTFIEITSAEMNGNELELHNYTHAVSEVLKFHELCAALRVCMCVWQNSN